MPSLMRMDEAELDSRQRRENRRSARDRTRDCPISLRHCKADAQQSAEAIVGTAAMVIGAVANRFPCCKIGTERRGVIVRETIDCRAVPEHSSPARDRSAASVSPPISSFHQNLVEHASFRDVVPHRAQVATAMRGAVDCPEPRPHGLRQFALFVGVGIFNTGFSYGAYVLFVYAGLAYAIANLCALCLGILFSFRTQGILVFKEPSYGRFFWFVSVWMVIYGVNTLLIGLFIRMGFNAYVGGAFALPVTTALSFVAQKYFVFRKRHGVTPSR
jgi:putative flippase GtrA